MIDRILEVLENAAATLTGQRNRPTEDYTPVPVRVDDRYAGYREPRDPREIR